MLLWLTLKNDLLLKTRFNRKCYTLYQIVQWARQHFCFSRDIYEEKTCWFMCYWLIIIVFHAWGKLKKARLATFISLMVVTGALRCQEMAGFFCFLFFKLWRMLTTFSPAFRSLDAYTENSRCVTWLSSYKGFLSYEVCRVQDISYELY